MIDADRAAQLVCEVLLQGGLLICSRGLVMHKTSIEGLTTFAFFRNSHPNANAEEVYNGIAAEKAALAFTEWVGAFEALGLATKWFRAKHEKTLEASIEEKSNA